MALTLPGADHALAVGTGWTASTYGYEELALNKKGKGFSALSKALGAPSTHAGLDGIFLTGHDKKEACFNLSSMVQEQKALLVLDIVFRFNRREDRLGADKNYYELKELFEDCLLYTLTLPTIYSV